MGFLSDEELKQLTPAENSAFPAPIPTQSVSSDEFMPAPQTKKQREFEARIKAHGNELARHQGLSRRGGRSGQARHPRREQRAALASRHSNAQRWETTASRSSKRIMRRTAPTAAILPMDTSASQEHN